MAPYIPDRTLGHFSLPYNKRPFGPFSPDMYILGIYGSHTGEPSSGDGQHNTLFLCRPVTRLSSLNESDAPDEGPPWHPPRVICAKPDADGVGPGRARAGQQKGRRGRWARGSSLAGAVGRKEGRGLIPKPVLLRLCMTYGAGRVHGYRHGIKPQHVSRR